MAPRILVVEDDLHFADILRDYLRFIGFAVDHAPDGEAALASLETTVPDVVLTDVLLPKLNGLELAARIKSGSVGPGGGGFASPPVILMSAVYKDDAAIQANLKQCGADDYLIKPFPLRDLRSTFERLLPPELIEELVASSDPDDPELSVITTMEDLGRSGGVEPGFLPPLLLRIRSSGHTGVLSLRAPPRWKDVVFLNGHPVWADGGDEHDRLGTMLLEDGIISRDQFREAVEAMKSDGLDFGSALTELGILAPTGLYTQLRRLVERRFISAFAWTVGSWTLSDVFPKQTPSFQVELLPAILKGLEAHADAKMLWSELKRRRDQYVIPTSRFAVDWPALKVGEGVGALGAFLSGRRTLGKLELMEVLPPADFKRAIWLLWKAGMIGFGRRPAEADSTGPITVSMGLRAVTGFDRGPTSAIGERILRDYFKYWQTDFFAIFGLLRDVDQETVDQALTKPVLDWSPADLESDTPGDVRAKAEALTEWVAEARRVLSSPIERHEYAESLAAEVTGVYRPTPVPELDEAAMFFELGRGYMQTNDFQEAEAAFRKAADRAPQSALYHAYRGWAAYRRANREEDAETEAVASISKALEIDPNQGTAHYFMGVVHRDSKHYGRAVDSFQAAVKADPQSDAARTSLREALELSGRFPVVEPE